MGPFTAVTVNSGSWSITEVEAAVQRTGGTLDSYGFGFDCPKSPPDGLMIGNWLISLVNKQGMGNHGSYVAIATTPETYKFQMEANLRLLRFTAEQAGCDLKNWSRPNTIECGPVMLEVCLSPLWKGGMYMGEDDLFKYFCYPHENYVRMGDDRYRVWVKLK